MFFFSKSCNFFELRDSGVTKELASEKLNLSRSTTDSYEAIYREKNVTAVQTKAIKGTTQVVSDTLTRPIQKWNTSTIMLYVGIFIGVVLIFGLVSYGLYQLYRWIYPNKKTTILEETLTDITKRADERSNTKYEQKINELKRENNQLKDELVDANK